MPRPKDIKEFEFVTRFSCVKQSTAELVRDEAASALECYRDSNRNVVTVSVSGVIQCGKPKQKPNLFAFSKDGDDPHEIKLCLSAEDRRRYSDLPKEKGVEPITVTDEATGKQWLVRPENCGLSCYCACMATPIKPNDDP
jgi:hypothetical protein